jgi:hypothetical protein
MSKRVLLLTTCDGERYKPMIDATEELHKRYARKHGYDYKRYDGVVRGFKPWHATFNRIYLLQHLVAEGVYDWVLYMDADAVIVDFNQSLTEFLDDRYAIVSCRGSSDDEQITWSLNIGICFFNLKHPHTKLIINKWRMIYENVPDDVLKGEKEGVFDDLCAHINDQDMLCVILFQEFRGAAKIYRKEQHNRFNYDGPFIKQIIRNGKGNTVADRLEEINRLVDLTNTKYPVASSRKMSALL